MFKVNTNDTRMMSPSRFSYNRGEGSGEVFV